MITNDNIRTVTPSSSYAQENFQNHFQNALKCNVSYTFAPELAQVKIRIQSIVTMVCKGEATPHSSGNASIVRSINMLQS
jgi:hypothetical protein